MKCNACLYVCHMLRSKCIDGTLPRRIALMTACTGSEMFELVARALVMQLNSVFSMTVMKKI